MDSTLEVVNPAGSYRSQIPVRTSLFNTPPMTNGVGVHIRESKRTGIQLIATDGGDCGSRQQFARSAMGRRLEATPSSTIKIVAHQQKGCRLRMAWTHVTNTAHLYSIVDDA
ncbi:hypothetical protein QCA50_000871 [Cerrena zonata]|uniref:Uncharacterized protein n=1 Tax=Cerrena zonata TaxID=2478898 RepID=A0AAW0GS23_9APHY